jgi:hypothetical protein
VFEMSPSLFLKMVKKFVTMLEPCHYQFFVLGEETHRKMRQLTQTDNTVVNFPCARYATDITLLFQQASITVEGQRSKEVLERQAPSSRPEDRRVCYPDRWLSTASIGNPVVLQISVFSGTTSNYTHQPCLNNQEKTQSMAMEHLWTATSIAGRNGGQGIPGTA